MEKESEQVIGKTVRAKLAWEAMEREAGEWIEEGWEGRLNVRRSRGTKGGERGLLVRMVGVPGQAREAGKRDEGVRSDGIRGARGVRTLVGGGMGRDGWEVVAVNAEEAERTGLPVLEQAGMCRWEVESEVIGEKNAGGCIADRSGKRDDKGRESSGGRIAEAQATQCSRKKGEGKSVRWERVVTGEC